MSLGSFFFSGLSSLVLLWYYFYSFGSTLEDISQITILDICKIQEFLNAQHIQVVKTIHLISFDRFNLSIFPHHRNYHLAVPDHDVCFP